MYHFANKKMEINSGWIQKSDRVRPSVLKSMRRIIFYYHPPTKLWKGNVFSCVCHSVYRGSPCTATPVPSDLKHLYYEAKTVRNRAVGIRMKCLFVLIYSRRHTPNFLYMGIVFKKEHINVSHLAHDKANKTN